MGELSSCTLFQFPFILAFISLSNGDNMGPLCSGLTEVRINYKNYYDVYLGDLTFFPGKLDEKGLFVTMLKQAVQMCCSTAKLTFIPIPQGLPGTPDKEIEEMVLETGIKNLLQPPSSKIDFFFPEFLYKKLQNVYDTQAIFIRLSRSPGPALLMHRPKEKEPVFVGEVFLKSWAIIIFLITFAWIVGILVWICVSSLCVQPKKLLKSPINYQ